MIHKRNKKTLTLVAAILLATAVLPSALPFVKEAHADANLDFSVSIAPILNINIPKNLVKLNFAPTTSAAIFDEENLAVTVSTNYKSGYDLKLEAASTDLARNSQVTPVDGSPYTPTIPTLASTGSPYTQSSFTVNSWGVKVSTDATADVNTAGYIPFSSGTIAHSTVPVADSVTNVTLAAKTDITQAAGTYELVLNFTAVPRITQAVTIDDLYYMQDFRFLGSTDRTNVLNSMTEGTQYRLHDQRDEKQYYVAKLCTSKSGNTCNQYDIWMTQNLDHVIKTDGTVTYDHQTTDLGYGDSQRSSWDVENVSGLAPATISAFNSGTTSNVVTGWGNTDTAPRQAEGGDHYVITDPSTGNISIVEGEAGCVALGYTTSQCAHYHIGNYYNWTAAVASTSTNGINTKYKVMPESICPAGWRLPNGLTSDGAETPTITQSDFNALLGANGITGSGGKDAAGNATTNGIDLYGSTNVTFATGGFMKMTNNPFYFVRAGYVGSTTLNYFADYGYYWSSTVVDGSLAYFLGFSSGGLWPAYQGSRSGGWSVRCVAR